MKIAVLKESEAGERRVAATPETVKKYVGLGASVAVETGAGDGASIADHDYVSAGAIVGPRGEVLKDADAILVVQGPDVASLNGVKPGVMLVGALNPFGRRAQVDSMRRPGSTRWRWNSRRASPAPSRWTSSRARPTSPATRQCSMLRPNMAAPFR